MYSTVTRDWIHANTWCMQNFKSFSRLLCCLPVNSETHISGLQKHHVGKLPVNGNRQIPNHLWWWICVLICYEMDLRCQKLKRSMLHVNSCVQSSEASLPYSMPSDSGTSIKLPRACAWLQMLYVTCVTHTGAKGMAVGTRCQLFKPCS